MSVPNDGPPLPVARRGGGLPGLALRRPVTVLTSLAALLLIGGMAAQRLPLQLLPTGFAPPFMWVDIPTLSAAPSDNERDVAEPVEAMVATLPHLKRLRTWVRSSSVGILVELDGEANVDAIHEQLRDRLDRVGPTLPEGSRQSFIWRHDPNDDAILIIGLTLPHALSDPHELLLERLARPLERLPGVSAVQVDGVRPHKVRVQIRDTAARAHGLDSAALVQSLMTDNFNLAAGALEAEGRRALVRAVVRYPDLDTIGELPVGPGLLLRDVAAVTVAPDPEASLHRVDGSPAAALQIYKEAGANTVEISRLANERLLELLAADTALRGVEVRPFFDQGAHISESVDQLRTAALYGGVLAVLVLFFFLRSIGMTFLITAAIPLCLLATLAVLAFTGESLNVMSMMGLMLSVGMVIDNAIVVLENIDRLRRQGVAPRAAAVEGAREVSLAITLATLTTLVVFLPMILLGQQPMVAFFLGRIGFPVCYALVASLFVALVYLPVGGYRLSTGRNRSTGWLMGRLVDLYGRQLGWALRHRLLSAALIIGALLSAGWPMGRIQRVDQIEAGIDAVRIHLMGPPNGSRAELEAVSLDIERAVMAGGAELDLRTVLARDGWAPEHILIQVFLKPAADRELSKDALLARLEALVPERPGYRTRVGWRRGGGGADDDGGIAVSVSGPDTQISTDLARQLAARLAQLPGATTAYLDDAEDSVELRYSIQSEVAARSGLTAMSIGLALDYTLRGRRLPDFQEIDRARQMVVELDPDDRADTGQVAQLPLQPGPLPTAPIRMGGAMSGAGQQPAATRGETFAPGVTSAEPPLSVALERVTRSEVRPGYARIKREDRKTTVTVRVVGDESALFDEVQRIAASLPTPPGYEVDFGSRFRNRDENEEGGLFAVSVAAILVFFLMGVLFESLILPFSIILSIPLAFSGVFWTLYLTGTPLDIMAIVGCIILVGVVVNNGIVLIDQVQQRRADGEPRNEALVSAARDRVRPILMTALTTIGGLIPMAVGNASLLGIEYAPLGRVVIGGLATGTALTLFAVPLWYTLLDDLRHLPRRLYLLAGALPGRTPGRVG